MCACDEDIRETDEVLEERDHFSVVARRGDLDGEVDTFLRDGIIEPVNYQLVTIQAKRG